MICSWGATLGLAMLAVILPAAGLEQTKTMSGGQAGVAREAFGNTGDGIPVEVFTLTNKAGVEIKAISFGAILTSIRVPDRTGALSDVALGFDTLDGYLKEHPFFGAVVGRYGNRIGKASFTLDGRTYKLAANNGPNHLHGGVRGFDKYVWTAEVLEGVTGVAFTRTSPDGEEGYPGTVQARVSYVLSDTNELSIEYRATTDKATPINLTQHTYFNLAGHNAGSIVDHELTLAADRYTPVDATLIPTGELAPVAGTPLDFRQPTRIGARIDDPQEQIKFGLGYDHNWVINRKGDGLQLAARVFEPKSGRTLDVQTTEPGVQFYTGNFLDGSLTGKGATYVQHAALCLETQKFPNAINVPSWRDQVVLRPGQSYRHRMIHAFTAEP
jgi:aldose 1-epimerase